MTVALLARRAQRGVQTSRAGAHDRDIGVQGARHREGRHRREPYLAIAAEQPFAYSCARPYALISLAAASRSSRSRASRPGPTPAFGVLSVPTPLRAPAAPLPVRVAAPGTLLPGAAAPGTALPGMVAPGAVVAGNDVSESWRWTGRSGRGPSSRSWWRRRSPGARQLDERGGQHPQRQHDHERERHERRPPVWRRRQSRARGGAAAKAPLLLAMQRSAAQRTGVARRWRRGCRRATGRWRAAMSSRSCPRRLGMQDLGRFILAGGRL